MQLEDFFEFETFDTTHGKVERIRIKGHRISIEHVLRYYKEGLSPETIVRDVYPALTLEEVHATITYYLHERQRIEEYMRKSDAIGEAYYQEYLQQEPPDVVKRLRALKAQQAAASQGPASRIVAP